MIRPGTLDDVPGVHTLMSAAFPGFVTSLEGRRYALSRHLGREDTRWFAADADDALVGWASVGLDRDTTEPSVFWLNIGIDDGLRETDLRRELYESAVAHARSQGARTMTTITTDDESAVRFLGDRGWEHTHTERISSIDPRTVPAPEPPGGVSFVPFAAFDDDPRPVYDIDMEVSLDIPGDFPFDNVSFEEWHGRWWEHPDVDLELSAVAIVDGTPVAISMLRVDRATGRAANDITGTLRSHRGRGLATLVKRETSRRAAQAGVTVVITGNDATNAPMLRVNEKLGYRPLVEQLSWVTRLT